MTTLELEADKARLAYAILSVSGSKEKAWRSIDHKRSCG